MHEGRDGPKTVRAPARARRPLSATISIALEYVSSIFGIGSGLLLMAEPSGAGLGFPSDFAHKIPTGNFFLVGVWLFVAFGIFPALFAWGLTTRRPWGFAERVVRRTGMHWAWAGALVICILELIFIGYETTLIGVFGVTTNWAIIQVVMIIILLLPPTRKYFRVA